MSEFSMEDAAAHLERVKAERNTLADRIARAAGFDGEIRPGAIVSLKSGGPAMTIAVFDVTDGLVYCHWIVHGRPYQARYSPEMLEPAEKDGPTPPPKRGPKPSWGDMELAGDSRGAAITAESAGESAVEDSRGAAITHESAGEFSETDSPAAAVVLESDAESSAQPFPREETEAGDSPDSQADEIPESLDARDMLASMHTALAENIAWIERAAAENPNWTIPRHLTPRFRQLQRDVDRMERDLARSEDRKRKEGD
jgi:uncharacterized protein YodC (DUF2158 family)